MTAIAALDVTIHERPNPLGGGTREYVVLRVVDSDGRRGTAFLAGPGPGARANAAALAEVIRPILVGADPRQRGLLWQKLWGARRTTGVGVVGAVDAALWDLAGVTAGVPIHELLGTTRTTLPVYISSWVHRSIEAYVDEALHYQALGVTAYKLHPPTQQRYLFGQDTPIGDDLAALRAVREAVGPEMVLMNDSPHVYSYDEALRVGKLMEELDYHWFEDPLPVEDIYGYQRLRQHLHIPIVATEMTGEGPYGFAPWITARATDYLRGDIHLKGGITALMRIAHTAEAFRLGFEVHDGFTSVGNLAGLHVAMAVPTTSYFELLTIQPSGTYGLANASYGLAEELAIDPDGFIHAPTRPGLGLGIDEDLLAATRVELH